MLSFFFEGVLLGLLVAISLGPAFFAILQTGITKGFRYGIYMSIGVLLSDVLWVTVSYLIGATIFDDPENKVYVGLIGGIILIIFGSVSWAKKPEILKRRRYSPEKVIKESRPIGYSLRGFFLNIANPFLFFFWFGALGFVGKNSAPGEILESTIAFFSGTFITVFATDALKSFVGGKIKGFLKPRKEIIVNKFVGILLVTFGIVLIFKTLSGIGFFEQLKSNLHLGKQVEAQYNISLNDNTLHLILFKDSTFNQRLSLLDKTFKSEGIWYYIDTVSNIFELEIQSSDIDTIKLPAYRRYQLNYSGIKPVFDSTIMALSPMAFINDTTFSINKIEKAIAYIPNNSKNANECGGWSLNEQQIRKIISQSIYIDTAKWNSEFDLLPCMMNIDIQQENKRFNIQLNAGGWFSVNTNDSTIYYGNFNEEDDGLVLNSKKQ